MLGLVLTCLKNVFFYEIPTEHKLIPQYRLLFLNQKTYYFLHPHLSQKQIFQCLIIVLEIQKIYILLVMFAEEYFDLNVVHTNYYHLKNYLLIQQLLLSHDLLHFQYFSFPLITCFPTEI